MASIQIRADIVLKACEKTKEKWLHQNNHANPANSFYMESVEKIKKLAEYAIKSKPSTIGKDNELCIKLCSNATITIDHNDFELIGEFL